MAVHINLILVQCLLPGKKSANGTLFYFNLATGNWLFRGDYKGQSIGSGALWWLNCNLVACPRNSPTGWREA